ncbi:MAG: sigma-70 family RNA polymerase sigma factor [Polyangiaceae bacterium]|nr:sigma-70 family RNA polymerase sigma factor [Polyangiaceae bacterium]
MTTYNSRSFFSAHSSSSSSSNRGTRYAVGLFRNGASAVRLTVTANSDETLLAALLHSENENLWRRFLARYEALVLSAIRRALRDMHVWLRPHDVDDVYAGFLAALLENDRRALRSYDPTRGTKVSTWMAMLAWRFTRDTVEKCRTRWRFERLTHDTKNVRRERSNAGPSAETMGAYREVAAQVRDVVSSFTGRQREMYELYFGLDLTAEEVAARRGTAVQTVHAGRHKLAERIAAALKARAPERRAA